MNYVDLLGWVGTTLSLAFYLLLAVKKIRMAYVLLTLSAIAWGAIGLMTELPSLVAKEAIVGVFIIWGWRAWRTERK